MLLSKFGDNATNSFWFAALCLFIGIITIIVELWIAWIALAWLLVAIFGSAPWFVIVFFIIVLISITTNKIKHD